MPWKGLCLQYGNWKRGRSSFCSTPLRTCPSQIQMSTPVWEGVLVLIWGTQIHVREQAISQILNPQVVKVDCSDLYCCDLWCFISIWYYLTHFEEARDYESNDDFYSFIHVFMYFYYVFTKLSWNSYNVHGKQRWTTYTTCPGHYLLPACGLVKKKAKCKMV